MTLYSIGHSNISIEAFLALLQHHQITVLVDTRSQPYSRYNPQFRREALQQAVMAQGFAYHFLGDRIGGKPAEAKFYLPNGKVDYDLLRAAPAFQAGIKQLLALAGQQRVAFMCAEADYKHCHRYWLITRTLVEQGVAVEHILPAGDTASSSARDFEPAQPSLF